jgi:poly-beta-hydroxybutyrate-responsive repressor
MSRSDPPEKSRRKTTTRRARPKKDRGGPTSWSPRDLLIPYVLLAVSAQRAHGYYIEQYLRGLGLAQVEMTRLYRTLRQLEKRGLLTSAWEAGATGPARRVYSLTDAGRAWLRGGATMLEGYRTAIDAFFGKYRKES